MPILQMKLNRSILADIPNQAVRSLILIALALCLSTNAKAQIDTLASFDDQGGANPLGGVTISGGTLYGTTSAGGISGAGTVFSLPMTGGTPTVLTDFNYGEGYTPEGALILSGSTLYGTTSTSYGAINNYDGSVFSLPITGGTPTFLTYFEGTNGDDPSGNLTLLGSTLYGTTFAGGADDRGTVFSLPTNGGTPTVLTSFDGTYGQNPAAGVILSGGTLYGTTVNGGPEIDGNLFSLPASGGTPTDLATFNGLVGNGQNPYGSLLLSGSTLYGTTESSGAYGYGMVYSLPTNGGTQTILTSFNGTDGSYPLSGLTLFGDTLYGTTKSGGAFGDGTVFSLPITGGTPTVLASFNGTNGQSPIGTLSISGSTLYGTTENGGVYGDGTVFSIQIPVGQYFWSNAPTNGNWADGTNWAGGGVPTNGSALDFDASSITTLSNDIVNATNDSLNFTSNAPAYTINGNALTLTNAIVNNSTNPQTVNLSIIDPGGVTLATTGGGGNILINGPITGAGGVTSAGGGTASLNGSNSYTGATIVSGGNLSVSGSLNNSLVTVSGGNLAVSGSISGSNGITVSAGSATLSGNNSNNTGLTTLSGGTLTLEATTNNTFGRISYALARENSGFTFTGGTLQLLSDSNVTFAGGNNLAVNNGGETWNFYVDHLTPGTSNNTITFAPGGGLYTAITTVNVSGSGDGYTLSLGNVNGFNNAGTIYAANFNANGANLQLGGIANANLGIGGNNNTTVTGTIASSVSTVTMNGTGTLSLTGNNSFTGALTVNSGKVVLTGNNVNRPAVAANSTIVASGATLQMQANSNNTVNGTSYALSAEENGKSVTLLEAYNGSTLQLLSDSNVTFAGGNGLGLGSSGTTLNLFVNQLTTGNSNQTIGFAPAGFSVANTTINVTGAGNGYTLALGPLGAYTGYGVTLQPNGAALQVDGVTAWTGQAGPSFVTVNGSNTTTITGPVTGTSTLNQEGTGALILTASNTYTGTTTISTGTTLQLAGSGDLGSGNYTKSITNNGLFIDGSSANQILGGVISGTGGVTKSGAGTLTLGASNTYTGITTISSGALILSAGASITGSTNINLGTQASQGTLDLSANSTYTFGTNQTLSGYGGVKGPSSLLRVNGNITPGSLGGTTRGVISVNGNLTLGSASTTTFTINGPGTAGSNFDALDATGTLTYNGTLDLVFSTPQAGTFDLFSAGSFVTGLSDVELQNAGYFISDGDGLWSYLESSYDLAFNENTGVLTVSPVPEPSSYALFGMGLGALALGIAARWRRLNKA